MDLQNRYVIAFQRAAGIAALVIIVTAGAVLLGWWLDISILKTMLPGLPSMKPNTAVAFLLGGAALWLLQSDTADRRVRLIRRACIVLFVAMGALTLSEYLFGWNLGIDELLFRGASGKGIQFPGRMAPVSAISFCMGGIALWLHDSTQPRYLLAQLVALGVGLLALLGLVGYLYDVNSLASFFSYSALALHSAVLSLVLAVGILALRADRGWVRILTSENAGGVLARRLVPAVILVPIVLGWLRLLGDHLGLYDVDFGNAILIIAIIITFSVLIASSAVSLYRIDTARLVAENNLRGLYGELEARVAERTAELTLANQKLETQIAERRQIEADLRQSRERFGILFRNSPTGIVLARLADGIYLDANDSFLRATGFARDEVIGHTGIELGMVQAETRERNVAQIRAQGALHDAEIVFRIKSGEPRLFLFSVEQVEVDGELCSLSTIYDITDRKRAEQESQRLNLVLDRMAEGAQMIGFDWRYLYLNDAAAIQGRRSKDALIGHTMMEMYPGIEATPLFDILRRCMSERVSDHMENEFVFPDNGVGWFDLSIQPMPEGIFILTTDITHRKRAERALRESQERFAKAFSSSPAALTITRRSDNVFVDVNENFLDLFGYSRDQVIGHASTEFAINPNATARAEMERDMLADGVVHNREMVLYTQSGQARNMLMSVAALELDGEAHILTTMLDITSRKQAEVALEDSEAKLRALFHVLPVGVSILDRERHVVDTNPALGRILKLSPQELAKGAYADWKYIHADGSPVEPREFPSVRAFEEQRPVLDVEMGVVRDAGETVWTSVSAVPVPVSDLGVIVVTTDITERLKSEEAMIRVNAQLTERMREISFLNEMAEQLQTCLMVEEVYQVTAEWAARLFPNQSGAIYVIGNNRKWVETAIVWGIPPPEASLFGQDDCWALWRGHAHISGTNYPTIPCRHVKHAAPAFSICMPLSAQGETLGVFHLRVPHDVPVSLWNEGQQQLARTVSDSTALALANLNLRESLRQQSIRDPLTNLFNRRYMEESLERELHRAERRVKPVGIAMLDADHFKKINDTEGHNVGDAVLRQLGHFLEERTRDGDIACRYGGEEFTLILPEASLEETRLRAEQLRQEFEATPLHYEDRSLAPLTLSFGVAAYPEHGKTAEEVLHAADAALYRAKREGRNRVVVA